MTATPIPARDCLDLRIDNSLDLTLLQYSMLATRLIVAKATISPAMGVALNIAPFLATKCSIKRVMERGFEGLVPLHESALRTCEHPAFHIANIARNARQNSGGGIACLPFP